ncbi:MAG: ammonium transporter [Solirubrobacteraceae bacterium]|nr:ammonium transporter [Solirubrobacteraceae bacterium]
MDSGQIAWYLTAGVIVLFMTPGIAFFYGGLVKSRSVISMLMLSFGAMGIVGVLWVLYGFNMGTMASGDGNFIPHFVGSPFSDFGLTDMAKSGENDGFLAVFYGSTFAMATVALVSGAIADRARFLPWMLFAGLWATFNYFLVAGWVWSPGGWVFELGDTLGFDVSTIDYAGGTAVHINSAAAALALAIVLGKRVGFAKGADKAHNVPLTLIGVAILFMGWFGFNGGAAALVKFDSLGLIIVNTFVAATAGILGWIAMERMKEGKATSVGAGSGAIAGLVAITPACANLYPVWAILLGLLAGGLCCWAVELKYKFGFDDSLDVVGIHGVGGFLGCWYLGFFATDTGLFFGAGPEQLVVQVLASVGVAVFSLVITFIIGGAIEKTIGFRVANEDELAGVDQTVHGEEAYAFNPDPEPVPA